MAAHTRLYKKRHVQPVVIARGKLYPFLCIIKKNIYENIIRYSCKGRKPRRTRVNY